jgi:linoleoyl-CoA desaturase
VSATTLNKKRLVKFAPKGEQSFYDTVKIRVEEYFREKKIHENANSAMKVKTAVMLSMYVVPLVMVISGLASVNLGLFYAMWLIMGVGIVGIGTCVMHDSNHGSYSSNKLTNAMLGSLLNFIGGYSRNWRIQHNILHHTYTNVDGLDEDLMGTTLIRMSPHRPHWKIHRFQHIYAWFLYSLMNLFWVVAKDFRVVFRYEKEGLLKKEKVTLKKALLELTFYKVLYLAYVLALPIMVSGMPWYHVVGGFIAMHMVAGLSLACIFQPAHVMESSEFPLPSEDMRIENNWAVHQLLNTTNFAPGSKLTAWFIGGLNYQIEHHLFPQVCHIHYPEISPIVKRVAEEYGLVYNVQPTVARALIEHGRMLKILGSKP